MLIQDGWEDMLFRLGAATLVGLLLGLERERAGHDAGVRTMALVALSAAVTTVASLLLYDRLRSAGSTTDPLRVVQGIAQAIGFIAAGLIFIQRDNVRNLTTAATLWVAAALGIAGGLGEYRLLVAGGAIALLLLLADPLARRVRGKRRDER